MTDKYTIALAGNPNSGKSTLFNLLTGSRQQVGNYPGITVDKREGFLDYQGHFFHFVDLPGTYSLTAYSQEELVARNFLVENRPDLVVDVLDATNLERNLYLAVQFMELGTPLVLVLNMMDEVEKSGTRIDKDKLAELVNCPTVELIAKTGSGRESLLDTIVETANRKNPEIWQPIEISYGSDLDPVIESISHTVSNKDFLRHKYPPRWLAIKYLEEDYEIQSLGRRENPQIAEEVEEQVEQVSKHCQHTLGTHPEAIIADYRYGFINSVLRQDVLKRDENLRRIDFTDKIDTLLTHRLLGPLILICVLYGLFEITFTLGEMPLEWVQAMFSAAGDAVRAAMPAGLLRSLLVSGIIDGVGGVLSFVPLILIMFFGLSFLEDSGYMARIAYMLDRVFRMFGLHGYSVMPFIISGGIPGGCAVPGLMATRTLRSPKEKLATLLTAPFLTCGAKVPVFLLIGGAFFPDAAAQVLFWITLCGWIAAMLVARLLRSTIIRGESTPFVMELPPYRMPTFQGLCIHTWERGWEYIKKAGTIILAISVLLWAAMTFPTPPQEMMQKYDSRIAQLSEKKQDLSAQDEINSLENRIQEIKAEQSRRKLQYTLAGRVGTALEPVTQWAGFEWKTNIALIGGIAAKEVIVSSLGTAYSLGAAEGETSRSLSERLARDPNWNKATGLSIMVFVLLYAPCFVSVVTIARESAWKWGVFSIFFNTAVAFAISVLVYQVGKGLT
ncbi:MAG: ferrous iron transport protein B [Thermodesulfobacteriota bacterium]